MIERINFNEAKTSHCGINRVCIDPKLCACSRVCFCCVVVCSVWITVMLACLHEYTDAIVSQWSAGVYFPECSLVGQCVCGKPGPTPSTTTNSSLEICSPSYRYSPAADSPLICYRQISVMFLLCSSNFIPSLASLSHCASGHVCCICTILVWL